MRHWIRIVDIGIMSCFYIYTIIYCIYVHITFIFLNIYIFIYAFIFKYRCMWIHIKVSIDMCVCVSVCVFTYTNFPTLFTEMTGSNDTPVSARTLMSRSWFPYIVPSKINPGEQKECTK